MKNDIDFRWFMMTSSNGNIFRVAGPLWGESTNHYKSNNEPHLWPIDECGICEASFRVLNFDPFRPKLNLSHWLGDSYHVVVW